MGKIAKYGEQFEGSGYDFAPLILETSGGISTGGEDVLKQIFRFAAKQQGERYACFASSMETSILHFDELCRSDDLESIEPQRDKEKT